MQCIGCLDVLRRNLILISRRVAGRDLSSRSFKSFRGFADMSLTLRIANRLGLRKKLFPNGFLSRAVQGF